MIEIFFQETLEAAKIHEKLRVRQQKFQIPKTKINYDDDHLVTIAHTKETIQTLLIPILTSHIIQSREDYWLIDIISNTFYFKDIEEKQHILQIIQSITDGERNEIPGVNQLIPRERLIIQAFRIFLKKPISFSFESFLKFRLKQYQERLLHYVEIAIDEYKLEQEYQNFIQSLRDYVSDKSPKISCLHLLYEDRFVFFNENFLELKRNELLGLIDRLFLPNHPLHIDSHVIAPLVSIAPNTIYIYTNEIDDSMVQTIQNIFQEKVRIYSKEYFEQLKNANTV